MNTTSKICLLAITSLMVACSNSDSPIAMTDNNGQQLITLKVESVQSRAGRELTSAEAAQSIENVKVILTDEENTVVWIKNLSKWSTTDADVCPSGREATIEIPKEEFRMLVGALYHIYALGYSNNSDYDLSHFTNVKVNDKFVGDQKIKLNNGSAKAEEIFAGDTSCEGNVEGVRAEVVLNRQVAGTFGYLTKIPYVKDIYGNPGRYLMLVASNPQNEIILGKFDNYSGYQGTKYKGFSVVNGTNFSENNVIYTIDLKDWFNTIEEEIEESGRHTGLIKVEGNWKGERSKFRPGSVFAGAFIIPFVKTDHTTFKLHLCTSEFISSTVREWTVLLPSDASQLSAYDMWTYGDNVWKSESNTDDRYVYSVLRNHLYGIGVKNYETLPGWDPNNPDLVIPDDPDDEPEPINNKQEIPIIINHSWDAIYSMGVE